ncbi:hypothetical protein H6P81_014400 [Aristolochia fimbriata]|uniref:CCT domain-containing protein n=1 Tax=Aristolochia fimbriata TaxID=158543 RepID=A0AAV7EL14_ARIFI|nr:hypothetical protein H6P81_014400 [Aristolochia fimbriata]
MYAEPGLLFPQFQSFSQDFRHLEEFCRLQKTNAGGNLLQTTTVSDYDLGVEGDLFKAPESINVILEETVLDLDPVSAAISMISAGEDVMSVDPVKVAGMDSIQSGPLLSEDFYECRKELLAKSAIEESFQELQEVKFPSINMEEDFRREKGKPVFDAQMQKSVSSGCLSSVEWISGGSTRPSFLDFQGMDLGEAFGMRRAFSESDIQTLSNVSPPAIHSTFERVLTIGNYTIEERKQKLSRYRKKKSKRNFGRKIKYACRKALADSQPRVRGRFAKTEEAEVSNASK